MGSMVVLNDASDMIESNSTLTGSKTPEMMDSNIQTEDVDETLKMPLKKIQKVNLKTMKMKKSTRIKK